MNAPGLPMWQPPSGGETGTAPATARREPWLLSALFLLLALTLLFLRPNAEASTSLTIVFSAIILEAFPFMLLGALVGGVFEVFVSRERMASIIPRRGWLAVGLAAGMGLVFPVCECAVVPVVRRLVRKGLPPGAAVAYLLGAPIVNPVVAASTALAYRFDWQVVGLRLALGYGIAVVVGLLLGRVARQGSIFAAGLIEQDGPVPVGHHCAPGCGCHEATAGNGAAPTVLTGDPLDAWLVRLGQVFRHAAEDFLAVGHYLVIGAFVAALAQTYLDRSLVLRLSELPFVSTLFMMLLAVLLNLCSESDAFIAASFSLMLPLAAQLAFMLTGPMFDLKLLLMYQGLFRRRIILLLSSVTLLAVLFVSGGLELWAVLRP
ncbi:MAG: hypothetical protein BWK76_17055 [Desulfobulbaceae bacterium A2]|nr:MAG: hypothetical protein BWK76_17055 [Desulfobulbaceae bacterium A2]